MDNNNNFEASIKESSEPIDFVFITRKPAMEKKQRKLNRCIIDLVFIISYLVMLSGIFVATIGETHYHNNMIIVIGIVIIVLGAIIFGIVYSIDDEPRCFGGIDA